MFMFLTLTANFGIGLSFSKDPGSTFSEGPGKGLGLLYKVCPGKYRNLDIKSIKSKLSLECQKSEHPPKLLIAGPYKKESIKYECEARNICCIDHRNYFFRT